MAQKKRRYECEYCGKKYVREDYYLRHECKEKKRRRQLATLEGKLALYAYQQWIKLRRFSTPNPDSFVHSRYFDVFLRFADFVKRVDLPHVPKFIRFMHSKQYDPHMWQMNEVYVAYLEHIDVLGDPIEQANLTFRTMISLADEHECDISEIFECLTANEIVDLIHKRRFSPWVLLHSRAFFTKIQKSSTEEQIILETIIRPDFWRKRFEKHKNKIPKIKQMVSEAGL